MWRYSDSVYCLSATRYVPSGIALAKIGEREVMTFRVRQVFGTYHAGRRRLLGPSDYMA